MIQDNYTCFLELFFSFSDICRRKRVYFFNVRNLKGLENCFIYFFFFLFSTFLKWWKKLHIFKHFFFWNKERRGFSFYRLLVFLREFYTENISNLFFLNFSFSFKDFFYRVPNFFYHNSLDSYNTFIVTVFDYKSLFFFDLFLNNFNFFFSSEELYDSYFSFRLWFLYIRKARFKFFRYFLLLSFLFFYSFFHLLPFFYIFFCRNLKKPRKKKRRAKKYVLGFLFINRLTRMRYGFLKHFLLKTKRSVLNSFFLSTIFFKKPSSSEAFYRGLVITSRINQPKFTYLKKVVPVSHYFFHSLRALIIMVELVHSRFTVGFLNNGLIKHCNFFTLLVTKYEPLFFFNAPHPYYSQGFLYYLRCYLLIFFFLIC